jgi:hypothetical protein
LTPHQAAVLTLIHKGFGITGGIGVIFEVAETRIALVGKAYEAAVIVAVGAVPSVGIVRIVQTLVTFYPIALRLRFPTKPVTLSRTQLQFLALAGRAFALAIQLGVVEAGPCRYWPRCGFCRGRGGRPAREVLDRAGQDRSDRRYRSG